MENTKLKQSKYNLIYSSNNQIYFYNGITHSAFKCSANLGSKLLAIIDNPRDIEPNSTAYRILTENGILIPDQTDEISIIRELYWKSVNEPVYLLVIIPTLNCNFQCPYCVQEHIVSKMGSDTIQKLKDHIDYMIFQKKITSFVLEWFGGEPFLFFDEIILPISEYVMGQCEKAGIPFINGATTNASLIDLSVAKKLKSIRCQRFQITLDGNRSLHNKIKFAEDMASAFDVTLNNIVGILTTNEDSHVTLRINYTSATLKTNLVQEVCEIIPKHLRHRIKVVLKKVWQAKAIQERFEDYLAILDEFKKNGFNITRLDVITNFTPCYVNRRYYECVNYNGNVIKCTNCNDLYSPNARGEIIKGEGVKWNDNFDNANMQPSFENERCLSCKYLPICMGHCPKNHLEGQTKLCKLESIDMDMEKAIIAYIDDCVG